MKASSICVSRRRSAGWAGAGGSTSCSCAATEIVTVWQGEEGGREGGREPPYESHLRCVDRRLLPVSLDIILATSYFLSSFTVRRGLGGGEEGGKEGGRRPVWQGYSVVALHCNTGARWSMGKKRGSGLFQGFKKMYIYPETVELSIGGHTRSSAEFSSTFCPRKRCQFVPSPESRSDWKEGRATEAHNTACNVRVLDEAYPCGE